MALTRLLTLSDSCDKCYVYKYTWSLARVFFEVWQKSAWTKSAALKSLVTKNAWVKEFLHLCSQNCIIWIFGLFFEKAHKWKLHHWNPQEPRTWCMSESIFYIYKFFTYVIKTRAKLSMYSRKLGNYNGTIIFEIDIMKKSSPIN